MHHSIRDFHALTKTMSVANKNDIVIKLANTENMGAGDTILIDYNFNHAHRYTETKTIMSVDDTNTITLTSGLKMRHPCCIFVGCLDTMPRRKLLLTQGQLFNSRSLHIETQTEVEVMQAATQTVTLDDDDDDDSDSSFTSSDDSSHSDAIEYNGSIVIQKVKQDHDHVGLFSNNFIKLS